MQIRMVDPKTLEAHPQNPRVHHAIKKIEKSIQEFGFTNPVLVQKGTNRIIAGHGRVEAAVRGGVLEVPTIELNLSDTKAKAYMVADNKIAEESDWEKNLLKDVLTDLKNQDFDMDTLGFDKDELLRLLHGQLEEDEAPLPPENPRAKLGDIFFIGRHVLMCGDSANREDVLKLIKDTKADMVFTDPPYNVNYSGEGKKTSRTIEGDNQTQSDFEQFLKKAFQNYSEFTKENAVLYSCYASRTHREFEDALNASGWEVRNQIIWVKTVASMGWGDYRWKHEPIFYCHKEKRPSIFYGDRSQYTEWKEEKSDAELLKIVKKLIEKDESGESTVWRLKRDSNYDHPTQKPLQLCRIAIANSSKIDDVVLDLFGGSGSTLIACEQLERTCHTMEIDPAFCDVIIQRYCNLTKTDVETIYAQ